MQTSEDIKACITRIKKAAKLDRNPATKNTLAIKYGYTGGIQAVGPLWTANGELKPWCAVMEVAILTISGPDFHKSSAGETGQCCTITKATKRTNTARRQMNSSKWDSLRWPKRLRRSGFLLVVSEPSSIEVREPGASIMRIRIMHQHLQNYCFSRNIVRRRIDSC